MELGRGSEVHVSKFIAKTKHINIKELPVVNSQLHTPRYGVNWAYRDEVGL